MASSIRGRFEVHLIARPATALEGALEKLPARVIRPRLGDARTRYGLHPSQPMVTYWDSGVASDVIASAIATAENIDGIVRVKVEAMPSNEGVPTHITLPDDSSYWEIHAKIRGGDWDQAAAICAPFGVHLFWNGAKQDVVPVTNFRRYRMTYRDALREHLDLEIALAKADMTLDEIHYEYSVYDSAPELDEGWLFAQGGKKTDFLTRVPV